MLNGELGQQISRPSLDSPTGSPQSELSHLNPQMALPSQFRETVPGHPNGHLPSDTVGPTS